MAEVSSEYWAYNDPRWANDPAYGNPESMKYVGPWEQVLQATGFKGKLYEPIIEMQPSEYGGFAPLEVGKQYTAEAKSAIDNLRASGYDLRWKHPDRSTYNTYWGFVTPNGVQDIKIAGSDLGDAIMPAIKVFGAGLGLAGLGAGINSLLGGAGAGAAPANALAGGIGGLEGAAFADLAGGMLPEFGTIPAYSAGLGGGASALTAADLASFPADVLAQSTQGAEAAALPQVTAPAEATVPSLPTRPPLSVTPMELTPLEPFPVATSGPVTAPKFEFRELANFPTSAAGTNSLLAELNAGTGALGAGGIGGVESAALADIAGGMVPQFGSIPAYSAGLGAGAGALGAGVLGAGGGGAATAGAAGGGAATGAGVGAGGAGAGEDFLSGMSDVSGVEGSGVSGTGVLTKGTNIPSEVLGVSSDLDKILTFLKSPAGASALSGLGSLLGGVIQAGAAEGASEQQAEAARNALALSREMFEYQKNLLAPYQKYGTAALERLSGALGLEGAAKPQQALEMDPGYGFRLGEGLKALERMQAARGSMLSGGAMKAGQRYAQDYASGEYGNAYNRLANIAGLGQTAGTQLGNAASQFSTNAGNVMGQEANALAAGRIGRGSAYGNAIQGGLNAYSNYLNQQQQNQLFRDIFGRTAIGN